MMWHRIICVSWAALAPAAALITGAVLSRKRFQLFDLGEFEAFKRELRKRNKTMPLIDTSEKR
jgi:hypothetical protein